ncbi:PDR/VanB family oxidoreductase [Gordonia polyisoprenivorans]|uniref:PDR/VanB family oxidoreductase n=1 Tax=Gordonia polyisoprenivorans TaxID=84595 RepID=UPI001AD6F8D7|nr:PDR/VanB family oxidoreductase [Gordonia polyisoprenivorans]QTI71227.1 oxidoreductase [Gordonia polyisoprenivorans]
MTALTTPALEPASTLDLVVDEVRTECSGVVCVSLIDTDGQELPAWQPGAHIDLILGNGITRQYSLCGDTDDRARYTVAVLDDPRSRGGSRYIHRQLRKGDQISTSLPRNTFRLVDAAEYIFVAGGIGITPLLPMMAHARRVGRPSRLVYAGRDRARMAFVEQLAANPVVDFRVSGEGRRLDLATVLADMTEHSHLYACGPERLLDELHDLSRAASLGHRVHMEHFGGIAVELDADSERAFDVELARSGDVLRIAADQTILDAVLAHGIKAPNSCAEGVCGSCETTIISGEVDHRDQILDDDEKADNEVMMICCSRAACDRLVLDL